VPEISSNLKFFEHLCEKGSGAACIQLGRRDEALRIFQKDCSRTPPTRCHSAGDLAQRMGKDKEARAFFERGCNADDWRSCVGLRYYAQVAGDAATADALRDKAHELAVKKCDAKETVACHFLSEEPHDTHADKIGSLMNVMQQLSNPGAAPLQSTPYH
jgi:hypothetical protein